jgi:mannose-6-phosphate isomerase-like protein (cupin superfamily)
MMDATQQLLWFLDETAFEDTDRAGFRRRIVTGERLQLCFWRIAGGSTGSVLHHHPDHEQLGIVVRGRLELRIGDPDTDERASLGPGELYLAPPGIWHGDSVFIGDDEHGECWIMDVFAPPRDDWGTAKEAGKIGYGADGNGGDA